MQDFKYNFDDLEQRAQGEIEVTDWELTQERKASMTITIDDYLKTIATQAVATITVTEFNRIVDTIASIVVGSDTLVNGTDFTAVTDNDTTATDIAAAIDALGDYSASATGAVVTITVASAGEAGNSLALTFSGEGLVPVGFSGGYDHAVVTVDGNAKTQGTDWNASSDNDTTATNLAAAIDAIAGYSSSATGAIVTVEYDTAGSVGNAKVVTETGLGLTLSAGTLERGADHATIVIDGNTLTQGTDWTSATDDDTTAGLIATAIDGIAGFTASADGAIVTTSYETPGTGGNSKTTVITGTGLTVDGATLSGGVAETFSDVFDYSMDGEVQNLEATLDLLTISGAAAGLTVTPQYSHDGDKYFDHSTPFTRQTATNSETREINTVGAWGRFKMELDGTNPVVAGNIYATTH